MKEQQLEILRKVTSGDLTPENAQSELRYLKRTFNIGQPVHLIGTTTHYISEIKGNKLLLANKPKPIVPRFFSYDPEYSSFWHDIEYVY